MAEIKKGDVRVNGVKEDKLEGVEVSFEDGDEQYGMGMLDDKLGEIALVLEDSNKDFVKTEDVLARTRNDLELVNKNYLWAIYRFVVASCLAERLLLLVEKVADNSAEDDTELEVTQLRVVMLKKHLPVDVIRNILKSFVGKLKEGELRLRAQAMDGYDSPLSVYGKMVLLARKTSNGQKDAFGAVVEFIRSLCGGQEAADGETALNDDGVAALQKMIDGILGGASDGTATAGGTTLRQTVDGILGGATVTVPAGGMTLRQTVDGILGGAK